MTPWLLMLLICTEPFPAECSRPTIDEITSNPVCIAVSKSCTLHEELIYMPAGAKPKEIANICAARAAEIIAAEVLKGYRRWSRPECFERRDKP